MDKSRIWIAAVEGFGLSEATTLPLVRLGRLGGGVRQMELAAAPGIEGPAPVTQLERPGSPDGAVLGGGLFGKKSLPTQTGVRYRASLDPGADHRVYGLRRFLLNPV